MKENSQNNLILLTQKFPFESGEEFIGNEIWYLSEHYKKIYLIPTLVRDFSNSRELPENVEVVRFENPTGAGQIGINFFKQLKGFLPLFEKEVKTSKLSFNNLKYLTYHIPLAIKVRDTVASLIKKGQYFSFYSYWMDTNAFALTLLKKSFSNINFFIRTHNGDLYDERHHSGSVQFRKSVYNEANLIAPISHHGRQYIVNRWPQYSAKTKTYHLGVKQQSLNPIPTTRSFRIISCSSINHIKRVDKIIQVFSHLSLPVEWIHFGGQIEAIETLKNLATSSFKNHISFSLKGHISNSDLMEFYKNEACDIFINLSLFEGIPVSIMEAASFGLPILSNDVGGVKEIVQVETGILVTSDESSEAIAQKLEEFLKSGKSRNAEFRNSVRSYWKNNFDADKNYKTFIKEIKQYSCQPLAYNELK